MGGFYNTLPMKKYILRTSALWGRGLILALFTQYAYAITFAKTYGGRGWDVAYSVRQTSAGGYIVVGRTAADVILIKTDAKGNIQWAKAYGGKNVDDARFFQQTSDGGYIVAGYTNSFGAGELDIFLIKTDAKGNVQWAKTYGGIDSDDASFVQQTSDGGYIVAGETNSFGAGERDIFLIKTDAKGNIQWAKTYGGTDDDFASSVQQTSDGGYIVAGYTTSFGTGEGDIFLIKTDAKGNIKWAKTYGGRGSEGASSVRQTADGGYIVVGNTNSFGAGKWDIFLIKTDAKGNIQWAKTYGETDNLDRGIPSVQQTSDGGYILAGTTISFGAGGANIFLIKTNARGNIGSCSIVQDASPIVNNAPFGVTSQSPAISSPSPTVNSVSPTVTSPNLTVSAPCP